MKPLTIAFAVVGVVITIASIAARHAYVPRAAVVHVAVVDDTSKSSTAGCSGVAGLVQQALPDAERRAESTIELMATGDMDTDNEPVLVPLPRVPHPSKKALEQRGHAGTIRGQYLESVLRICGELGRKHRSPILRAVRRALEHLREYRDREPDSELQLLVDSDLQENVDVLPVAKRSTSSRADQLDNRDITVQLCGYSETTRTASGRGKVSPARPAGADSLRVKWTSAFTDPTHLKLDPFCPKFEAPTNP
jgi:hypothetical protein